MRLTPVQPSITQRSLLLRHLHLNGLGLDLLSLGNHELQHAILHLSLDPCSQSQGVYSLSSAQKHPA